MNNYLAHHGILGQKWGDQNGPPYPLDPATDYSAYEKKMAKLDKKFIRKNDKKIRKYAKQVTRDEMKAYEKELRRNIDKYNKDGKISKAYATAYSKKMAELMNQAVDGLESPSGKVVRFVAMRGEMDVYTALADKGYDMRQVKNGVYGSGKVAYRSNVINKMEADDRR